MPVVAVRVCLNMREAVQQVEINHDDAPSNTVYIEVDSTMEDIYAVKKKIEAQEGLPVDSFELYYPVDGPHGRRPLRTGACLSDYCISLGEDQTCTLNLLERWRNIPGGQPPTQSAALPTNVTNLCEDLDRIQKTYPGKGDRSQPREPRVKGGGKTRGGCKMLFL